MCILAVEHYGRLDIFLMLEKNVKIGLTFCSPKNAGDTKHDRTTLNGCVHPLLALLSEY